MNNELLGINHEWRVMGWVTVEEWLMMDKERLVKIDKWFVMSDWWQVIGDGWWVLIDEWLMAMGDEWRVIID